MTDDQDTQESFWGTTSVTPTRKATRPSVSTPATAAEAPSLLDLAEPLFQYVCRLNRSAKKGALHDSTQVRSEVKGLLSAARAKAAAAPAAIGQPALSQQWGQIEPVLLFFVDFMVRSSKLSFAGNWNDLAYEKNKEMAGDEKFFDLLDQALTDRSEGAAEKIAVFYTCIGLGFTGFYTGQPEYLRRKMLECSRVIRQMVDADPTSKICPDAYENVNTSNLIESPQASLVGILIALIGMIIVLFIANGYWYRSASMSLRDSIKDLSDTIHSSPPVLMRIPRNGGLRLEHESTSQPAGSSSSAEPSHLGS